jgi:hypothetical protein
MTARIIMLLAMSVSVFIAALPGILCATEPTGTVKLCRETDLVEPAQTSLNAAYIRLPTGLLLDDYGALKDPSPLEHRWPLTIITLKPVEMRPHVQCVTVPAIISPLSRVRSVSPADHRYLEIVGVTKGDGNDDPTAPALAGWFNSVHATVAREFR